MRIPRFILFALWLAATTIVLLTPRDTVRSTSAMVKRQPAVQAHEGTPVYRTVDDGDNWHLFWFCGLGVLAMFLPRKRSIPAMILIFSVLNLFSLASELVQEHLIPGRAFEWSDLAMNAVGISTGIGTSLIALHGRYHTKRFMRWTLR